ncbi:MAG: Flp pilus assembly protein CpaB [Anaerolineae bacterium]|nr:Flp pilus assembly protein CpaB [Anaerolineae bacterium]
MNRRLLLLLLLLLVGGGVAAYLLLTQNQPQNPPATDVAGTGGDQGGTGGQTQQQQGPTPTPIAFTEIVIAIQELPRGIVIPENGVITRLWPLDSFPSYGIQDPRDVIGKIARTDIAREAPVLQTQLVDNLFDLGLSGRGSDAAAVIPPGKVAIAVPVDRLTNVAHAPKSGDRVDVLISFLFVDVDEEFQSIKPNKVTLTTVTQEGNIQLLTGIDGRIEPSGDFPNPVVVGPSERQRPRLVTQRTIQNALVLNVGMFDKEGDFLGRRPTPTQPIATPGGPPTPTPPPNIATATPNVYNPDIVVLVVDPQDAVVLAWATESGLPMFFALRSAQDESVSETQAVTLEYMLTTYQIPQPPRLPYALEPPIFAIRQLIRQGQVSLYSLSDGTQTTTTDNNQ